MPPARVAPRPTASEMRAPKTMRLYMSRPMKSAPSQNTPPGRASEALASVVVGSIGAMTLAKMAVSTKTSTITAPTAPSG